MRVRVAGCLAILMVSIGPAIADEPAKEAPASVRHLGYAFESPRLLTQQLLWGLVHGVRQLANVCRESEAAAEVATAYADWLERYRLRIDGAARELAQHYFGRDEATLDALTAAIGLRPSLELDAETRGAACASFAEAIEARRYNLDVFFALRRDAAVQARADAVRLRQRRCAAELPEEAAEPLASAFAAWDETNGTLETVARARLAAALADEKGNRAWQRDAGVGAVPPAIPCDQLAGALAAPSHDLRHAFGEPE